LGIPEHRIVVVPYGVDDGFAPVVAESERATRVRQRFSLPAAFVLTVGTIEPRKNLARLLLAVKDLRSKPDTANVRLVHAGPYGWLAADVVASVKQLGLEDAVHFLGYVASEDLPVLYSLARVMVYPSLFEGFGLPVVEAMACGCPVVTSSVSSLPEVAGDAALLVDPTSVEEIAKGIWRVWTDAGLREIMRARGLARARQYSWKRAAELTAGVYEAAMG
jgi:glycosyltransferase involved in cell wall biosynthesis